MATKSNSATTQSQTSDYQHALQVTQRPDVGVKDQFSTRKQPKTYRYDNSLDLALSWYENRDRYPAEWLLGRVQRCATEGKPAVITAPQVWASGGVQVRPIESTTEWLQTLSQPFLSRTGKAERHQISAPTVPPFVHERHSTKPILEGSKHSKAKGATYGPLVVEATIAPAQTVGLEESAPAEPEAQSLDAALGDVAADNGGLPLQVAEPAGRFTDPATHIERMTQVLRRSKTLLQPGNREPVLADIRHMAVSDVSHAEGNCVAVVFGPEDGAMSDLLRTSRASEIFVVTGLPDAVARKTGKKNDDGAALYEVELRGLDIFNPATMDQEDFPAQNLPAWVLGTDYDSFYVTRVFFSKTATWDNLQKPVKAEFDASVWEHLAGKASWPFPIGSKRREAVKVIDERRNELTRMLEVK